MTTLRTIPYSAALAAATADNKIDWRWFVRMDIASPVGTKRFCNYAPDTSPGAMTLATTGTVATNGTTAIVGTGTKFLSDFVIGDTVSITGETSRIVASVTDNTHMALTLAASTTAAGLTASLTWIETDLNVGGLDQGAQTGISFLDFENINNTFGNWNQTPGLRGAAVSVFHVTFNSDGTLAGFVKMYSGMVGGSSHTLRSHIELMPTVNPYSRNGLWLTALDFGCGQFMPDPAVPVL